MSFEVVHTLLRGPRARIVTAVVCLLVIVLAGKSVIGALGQSDAESLANQRTFVCAQTGKSFRLTIRQGMTVPVSSPYSGVASGYEADELCFWTAAGQPKEDPTPVLLNSTVGRTGPTFCPDCGRLVRRMNPTPADNPKPPPTESEYAAQRASTATK